MSVWFQGELYCDYSDFGYSKCVEMNRCPEGLDEEEDDDLDDQSDYED